MNCNCVMDPIEQCPRCWKSLESERDRLSNEVKCKVEIIHGYLAEIDRLKAELESFQKFFRGKVDICNYCDATRRDRDLWKSKTDKLAEALRFVGSHAWAGGKSWVDEPHVKAALAECGEGK